MCIAANRELQLLYNNEEILNIVTYNRNIHFMGDGEKLSPFLDDGERKASVCLRTLRKDGMWITGGKITKI